jgi:hypothetical protein
MNDDMTSPQREISEPLPSELAPYPHLTACGSCRLYLAAVRDSYPVTQFVPAVLAFHESAHFFDPLLVANEHFA